MKDVRRSRQVGKNKLGEGEERILGRRQGEVEYERGRIIVG